MKIGFICEGKTEKNILESAKFQQWLRKNHIECLLPVIDAKGNGNLLPNRIEVLRQELLDQEVQKIIILTDLDIDRRMLKYGFTVENAAQHPNCPSANYFLTKLQTLASAN